MMIHLLKPSIINSFLIGVTVLTNIWAMTHDENAHPDPYSFKPERFLDEHGKVMEDRVLAFGFGRR